MLIYYLCYNTNSEERKIKKKLLILLCAITLVGCQSTPTATTEETVETTETTETTDVVETGIKYFGVGQYVTVEGSTAATEEKNATGKVDADIVAIGFDADYKIVSLDYDVVQASIEFDKEMNLPENFKTVLYPSKTELKDDYGMKVASGIGKEWYEQVDALEAYAVGKTVEELAVAITDKDADLLSGATFDLTGFSKAITSAKSYAVEVEGATKVGLGLQTNSKRSKSGGEKPSTLFEITIAGVATDDNGVVKANVIDMAIAQTDFELDGTIKNTEFEVGTKLEIKDAYGMKAASPIGKEWNEQAIALSEFFNGKNAEEILATKTYEKDPSHPAALQEEDLATSATITVETILPAMEAAIKAAK